MANELIYAFGISNDLPQLGRKPGFAGLETISAGGFHAIVKMVSDSEFSEENLKKNLADLRWLDLNARLHVTILSLLMEDYTVIPFNFGTIYHSAETLTKFIGDYSDSLTRNLEFIGKKEEWAIKIYSNQAVLKEHIDNLSPEAADLEKQIMSSSPGKAFLLSRKKIELIDNEIDRLCKKYGQECYNEFKSLSASTGLNNLVPKEFSGRNENMILNACFLVAKDRAIEFVAAVDRLTNKYSNFGFVVEATGPWPPFSFINL
ncbi:MAG: GvpL/GvpF family gas vesicle protein [bacterium]